MQVFIFDIAKTDPEKLIHFSECFSETEKNRLSNMISVKRRKEFILGHFLLRRLLCHLFDVDMSKAEVGTMQTGALYLPQMNDVYSSISHTTEKLAIAIAKTPIGVDIETIRMRDNFPALLNQIDAMDQVKELLSDGMSVQNAFYHLWCRREALYKLKSQTDVQEPHFYYNHLDDLMLCIASKESTDVEWIVKNAKDYYV